MFFIVLLKGISTGAVGTGFLSFRGFFVSLSSHNLAQFFKCISKEAVPNSLPLHKNYQI
jgi:hypothetical protein